MSNSPLKVLLAVLCVSGTAALAADSFVVTNDGRRIEADSIRADNQGTLELRIGGATQSMRRGNYRKVFTPKPKPVELLEKAVAQGRYDIVRDKAPEVFDSYKYLGWGGHVATLHGQAYLENDNPERALQLFNQGDEYAKIQVNADEQMAYLNKGKAEALLDLNRTEQALNILGNLKTADSDELAAFSFNASGRLLAEQGKKKEAVLEYLKTVLLFEPDTVPRERKEAKEQVVKLLKEMGDPRYEKFQTME
ncbi:MAG: CDC27 family protein [Candidatus Pacebacteria bacterium]|nr:CDC27 family protein [Candidatus Paceibacterota bacterium]